MRYKLLACAFVLLIATPALSAEFSPIVIKTGKPTPSVVRSGEPFKITYRAEFFDTVVIDEAQMQPGSIALEKVEVISLQINKNPFERSENYDLGFVNVWEFTYTFRVLQSEKGEYKIPSFDFIWVEKKAGVTEEEAKENKEPQKRETDEVAVGYVTSVVPPPPPTPLDIRDEQKFVPPVADGAVLRWWAYFAMGIGLLLMIVTIFIFVRNTKTRKSQDTDQEEAGAETTEVEATVDTEPILPPKKARKKFLRELKKLQSKPQLSKIRLEVRTLLLAELRRTIQDSMSENEIYAKLNGLNTKQVKQIGWKYAFFTDLARRLKGYQEDIDSGKCSVNPAEEIAELRETVSGFKFSKRLLSFVKRLTRGRQ